MKPGIIPLRPLAVGEILDGAFTAMRRYPKATFGLSAMVSILSALAQFALVMSLRDVFAAATLDPENIDFGDLSGAAAVGLLTIVITGLAGLLFSGMLTVVISEAVLGRKIELGNVWARVKPRMWALIGVSLLVGLVTVIGALACLLPGIYLHIALSFTTSALILEGQSVTGAMGRSRELIKGDWWRVFGILLLAGIIGSVVAQVIQTPFGLVGGGSFGSGFGTSGANPFDMTTSSIAIQSLGQMVASTVAGPITAGVTALLYIDRRMRREGLDVALAQAASAPSAAPTAGSSW